MFVPSTVIPWCPCWLNSEHAHRDLLTPMLSMSVWVCHNKIIISTCWAWSFPGMTYVDMERLGCEINSVILLGVLIRPSRKQVLP